MAQVVEVRLDNGSRIKIDPKIKPMMPVVRPPSKHKSSSITDLMKRDLESAGASAEELEAALESSTLSGVLMSIDEWIDQTIAAKGYIQAQEDREEFIIATGAGATKFNKWMKKAGLVFNKRFDDLPEDRWNWMSGIDPRSDSSRDQNPSYSEDLIEDPFAQIAENAGIDMPQTAHQEIVARALSDSLTDW